MVYSEHGGAFQNRAGGTHSSPPSSGPLFLVHPAGLGSVHPRVPLWCYYTLQEEPTQLPA